MAFAEALKDSGFAAVSVIGGFCWACAHEHESHFLVKEKRRFDKQRCLILVRVRIWNLYYWFSTGATEDWNLRGTSVLGNAARTASSTVCESSRF